jgi:hypothetical protein
MSVQQFKVGDEVKVGRGTTVFVIRDLVPSADASGAKYVMARVSVSADRPGQSVETSRLTFVRRVGRS